MVVVGLHSVCQAVSDGGVCVCVWQTGQRGPRGVRTGSWDSESSSANGHELKHEASKKRLGCENRKPRQLQRLADDDV